MLFDSITAIAAPVHQELKSQGRELYMNSFRKSY